MVVEVVNWVVVAVAVVRMVAGVDAPEVVRSGVVARFARILAVIHANRLALIATRALLLVLVLGQIVVYQYARIVIHARVFVIHVMGARFVQGVARVVAVVAPARAIKGDVRCVLHLCARMNVCFSM